MAYRAKELMSFMKNLGFEQTNQEGSHKKMELQCPSTKKRHVRGIVVNLASHNHGATIAKGTVESGMSEFSGINFKAIWKLCPQGKNLYEHAYKAQASRVSEKYNTKTRQYEAIPKDKQARSLNEKITTRMDKVLNVLKHKPLALGLHEQTKHMKDHQKGKIILALCKHQLTQNITQDYKNETIDKTVVKQMLADFFDKAKLSNIFNNGQTTDRQYGFISEHLGAAKTQQNPKHMRQSNIERIRNENADQILELQMS